MGAATAGNDGIPPAGPGVTVSILLTAVACSFCALCYAEFASLVPVAGSAYTYSYATLGEIVAWIIGWDLILEYAVGNIAVAISWAAYFRQLMMGFGIEIPAWSSTDYRSMVLAAQAVASSGLSSLGPEAQVAYQAYLNHPVFLGVPVVFNLPAVLITALITWLLVIGVKESARFNNFIVVLKVLTIVFFIVAGAFYVKPAHWHPFFPGGIRGVWTGASLIFFAYIGFDAISTAAEECKDPARDMPRGILGSLLICTILYLAAALVMTGMIPFAKLGRSSGPACGGVPLCGRKRIRGASLLWSGHSHDSGPAGFSARPTPHSDGDGEGRSPQSLVCQSASPLSHAACDHDSYRNIRGVFCGHCEYR